MSTWYPNVRAVIQVVFDGFRSEAGLTGQFDAFAPVADDGDSRPTIVDVLPLECNVHLNGYKDADTFDMTFDARVLPFSPELIRGAAVQIFMFESDGLLSHAQLETYATKQNTIIAGLIDNCSFTWGGDGHTFHVDGRDYTSLFLDKPFPADKKIPIGHTLQETLKQLVDDATARLLIDPLTGKQTRIASNQIMQVKWAARATPEDNAITHQVARQDKTRITPPKRKGAKGTPPVVIVGESNSRAHKHGIPVRNGSSYWDVMQRLCITHGYICFVQGTDVVIADPKVLNENSRINIPKMAFGRNLDELSVERHLGKESVPQILVHGRSRQGDFLEARFPEAPPPRRTGVNTAKEEIRVYSVGEVADVQVLKQIARAQYHALANTEAIMRFTTSDLRSLPGDDTVIDDVGANITRDEVTRRGRSLLQMRPGDAIQIGWDPFMTTLIRTLKPSARYDRLRQLGYSTTVSSLVARELERINQFRNPWYMRRLSYGWSQEDGLQIEGEGVNFVSVTRDQHAGE